MFNNILVVKMYNYNHKIGSRSKKLLQYCRTSRSLFLLPSIVLWWSKDSDCISAYSIYTTFAKTVAVIVLLVDVSRFLKISSVACIIVAACVSAVTAANTTPLPASTLHAPIVSATRSDYTSIFPQRKQSQTPLFTQQTNEAVDIQFVPLTREFIELLDDKERYNRYATPNQYDGFATNVSMSMYIEGISSFSAQTMDYQLDMYFYQEWQDLRLRHNGTGPMLIRDKLVFKKLWHPDIYFANARQASFQEITEDNFLLWVYPSGRIWYDCRISLVAICMMDLWKYPLDSQSCELRILSYAYPESQLRLRWSRTINPPIDRNQEIRMPDMRLVDIKTGECNGTYATGKWSCMTAVFYVQREMMHHVIQTYVPTALIVVISWFNFWLDIDSAPARVSLSITTLLTIATQANAVKLALPEVSYMKAIDVWMGMCMAFVFSVMVEYTIAHFAKNQELHRGIPNRNLLIDSTFSTLFDASNGGPNAAASFYGTVLPATTSTTFCAAPFSSTSTSAKTSASHDAINSATLRRSSISDRVRESLKQKRRSISALIAPLKNNPANIGRSLRAGEAEPLDMVLQYPPINCDYVDAIDDKELDSSEEPISSHPVDFTHNNGALQNPVRTSGKADENVTQYKNCVRSNTPEARLRIPHSQPDNPSCDEAAVGPAAASANISATRTHPVNFTLIDEDENEIVVVRKRSNRDAVNRIRKQVGRRAQEVRKSLCNLRGRAMANKIDQKSRTVFPCSFILFNIIYWSYYLVFN